MAKCYKDKERQCDEDCEAYCSEKRHGTHCLALAVQLEVGNRLDSFMVSSDVHSFFLKSVAQAIDSLKDSIKGAIS